MKSKFKIIIGVALGVLLVLIGSYIIVRVKYDVVRAFPFKTFFKWFALLAGIALVLWGAGYFIYWYFTRKKDEPDPWDAPKQPVDSKTLLKLWKYEWIKGTRMPHVVGRWMDKKDWISEEEPPLILEREDLLEIGNVRDFVDPSGQTSDRFLIFEVICKIGSKPGVHVIAVRNDLGEKWIRNNWNAVTNLHVDLDRFNLKNKTYPLASAQDVNDRLTSKFIALKEEGYTDEELALLEKYRPRRQAQEVVIKKDNKRKAKPVEKQVKESLQSEDETDDLEEDIEQYRRQDE